MSAFLGLDLGTSALKALIVDEAERPLGAAEIPLRTQHPVPLASEQRPEDWWEAASVALGQLRAAAPAAMAEVVAIGLSGQMHAALLLDAADRPVRPAMLWNDGRAFAEADQLRREHAELAAVLGVRPMAGFTAPKLAWLARHEPAAMAAARTLLMPKDLLRLCLTGERATDVSDAAGSWLLDQRGRCWSARAVAAVGVDPAILPRLLESTDVAGTVRPDLARRFGMRDGVIVAGGGGDTPCGGVGIGAVAKGMGYVALGTSAQMFVAAETYRPAAEQMVHAFCHALPGRWYQMAALLNGASVLGMLAGLLGAGDIGALLQEVEATFCAPAPLLVLPYLSGERTPHDDPHARGVVFGLTPSTTRTELVQAALEGVAFSLVDARDALAAAGARAASLGFIGGGARSRLWARIIASALDSPLRLYAGGARGPAFGAARLARLASGSERAAAWPAEPAVVEVIVPEPRLVDAYADRLPRFRSLYRALRPEFEGFR